MSEKNDTYWTDYPITELGDTPHKEAPIRECFVLDYDGDKYCNVLVAGAKKSIKSGYIYTKPGRIGKVPCIGSRALAALARARGQQ